MKQKIFKSLFAVILICSIFSFNIVSVGAAYQGVSVNANLNIHENAYCHNVNYTYTP